MGTFMDEYFRTVLEKSEAIRAANEELTKATLIAIGYQKGVEEARSAAPAPQNDPLTVNTGGESCDTEGKMLIDVPGVSMTSKPRADGRYQAVISRDGKRKYLYGRTPEEVKIKIQLYLREHGTRTVPQTAGKAKGPALPRIFFELGGDVQKADPKTEEL